MYVPPSNAEHDVGTMLDFVAAHPFGVLVTSSADGLVATHLPFVVHRARGPFGTLEGHVARANPHHRVAAGEALVIFAGPDAYVTPGWYPSKAEHGRVVPTWNYVAVHARGTPRFTDDPAFLRRHLAELTDRHEAGRDLGGGPEHRCSGLSGRHRWWARQGLRRPRRRCRRGHRW